MQGNNLVVKIAGRLLAAIQTCSLEVGAATFPVSAANTGASTDCISGVVDWTIKADTLIETPIRHMLDMVGMTVNISFDTRYGASNSGRAIVQDVEIEATVESLARAHFVFVGSSELDAGGNDFNEDFNEDF